MNVAIHQPHYFPWLGYLDKMAKVDKFIIMDMVQLENRSYMCRNRILDRSGNILLLTVPCLKKGYREKPYKDIEINAQIKWQKQHRQEILSTFKYSPYLNEIMYELEPLFKREYKFLLDVTVDSIQILRKIFDINTEILFQSALPCYTPKTYEYQTKEEKRSQDVLSICQAVGATQYLTGTGASLTFLNINQFEHQGIKVALQNYECPVYEQRFSHEFIPNLSALDLLLNMGIEQSKKIFWKNIQDSKA